MAAALAAQEPWAEPAHRAEGAPHPAGAQDAWMRDWDAIPNPLGIEALSVVLEVLGWLNWATLGFRRNRWFNAVLLWRREENPYVPFGGRVALEDHKASSRPFFVRASPTKRPGCPALPEGGVVLRVTDAEANVWLPRALRTTLIHWRYCPRNPPPPQPGPLQKRKRR